jgi:ATP-dependent DNA helicase DinG
MSELTDQIFGAAGVLAARFDGYQPRAGQIAMVEAVEAAIVDGVYLACEAPTGTGKTVAYGVPATRAAAVEGKRTLIVTANIALQEQIVDRDLPMLAEILPWRFSHALLKGRQNFLCLDRLDDLHASLAFGVDRDMEALLAWAKTTSTGDRSELAFEPEPRAWAQVSVSPEQCKGKDCPFYEACFAERARTAAFAADVVVTNYHMLFAHVAVKQRTGLDLILPEFDVLILDEAHKAADIAREFLGSRVSYYAVRTLAREAARAGLKGVSDELERSAQRFFADLGEFARSARYRIRLTTPNPVPASALLQALGNTASRASAKSQTPDLPSKEVSALSRLAERCQSMAADLRSTLALTDANQVISIETDREDRGVLVARLLDVSGVLRSSLFDGDATVIVTSATLTTTPGDFSFLHRELGSHGARELEVETPFDFAERALLIVPDGLPDPQDPAFTSVVASTVAQVVEHAEGRTLGLFTSYRALSAAHERLQRSPYRVLRQGDAPRSQLVAQFRQDVSSVLLGTESFWAGVDVPGESLSCVVIDRLPFPHPEDPVVDAMTALDRNAWASFCLPRALIAFKQGFGRLIRSASDRGVVVVLDNRIVKKGYGRQFIAALPSMPKSRDLRNIAHFLGEVA